MVKDGTEEINKLSLRFKNGSQIKAIASNESAGRSEALSLLIIDEARLLIRLIQYGQLHNKHLRNWWWMYCFINT